MFEGFDDVAVPDQWNEITNRAAGPGGPAFEPGGGHRIAFLVATAAAVGLAGVLWVGLADGNDLATVNTPADTVPETTSPATTAPATTAAPTTVEVTQPPPTNSPPETAPVTTTLVTTAPITTAPPSEQAFECQDSVIEGVPDGLHEHDPVLDYFGPLDAAPALDITTNWPGVLNEGYDVVRVESGTAILLQTRYDQQPGWSVTVVDDNGSIRWRRCDFATEALQLLATSEGVVVAEQDPADPNRATTWRMLDAQTGADRGSLPIPSDLFTSPYESGRFRLFRLSGYGDPAAPEVLGLSDKMYVLDTATTQITEVPYPSEYYGQPLSRYFNLADTSDGSGGWTIEEPADNYPAVRSIFVHGSWTSDPDVIRGSVPITIGAPDFGVWSGIDPFGEPVWTLPDFGVLYDEGPIWRDDREVSLLGACTTDVRAYCTETPGLIGVDRSSGTVLWQLAGYRQFAVVGDGYAIIGDGTGNFDPNGVRPGWIMIDTSTGETLDGQVWPDYETFNMGGSMEEDGMWVRREGGVVLAVNGDHIRVWMPADHSNGTINVSLPT